MRKKQTARSTSILEYINKNFATNIDKIYVNNIIQVLLDQNKIQNKPTLKCNSYCIIETNNMTIFDETGSMHENAKDDTLNK